MVVHSDMLEQARKLHQTGKLADAERVYRQVLQANGHDAEVWYLLGDTVQGQGRLAEAAVAEFHRALELRPAYGEVYNNLGLALIELRRSAEAAAYLQQGSPPVSGPRVAQQPGASLGRLGRFDEAEACYGEALRLNPI